MIDAEKICIFGGGTFGIALAKLAAKNFRRVSFYARDQNVADFINQNRFHPKKLSHIRFDSEISAVSDMKSALENVSVVVLTIPMKAMPEVLTKIKPFLSKKTLVVSSSKGIEPDHLSLPCDLVRKNFSGDSLDNFAFLSGPSFAAEIVSDLPTAMTLGAKQPEKFFEFQKKFSSLNCRLYLSEDVVGVCLGGALKNVVAIAAGTCMGLCLGKNALASLITRGLTELSRLAQEMGAHKSTLSGLSGLGDLVLSCTDSMSRNFQLGNLLAENLSLEEACKRIDGVVEGANTARAIPKLCKKYGVDLPICLSVYQVLYEDLSASEALNGLLSRKLGSEFW